MLKTVAIIQARMASERLPGKVLMEAAGKPLLQHMIERLQQCEMLDEVVIATTKKRVDWPIGYLLEDLGIAYYRGSEPDVLDRVLRAARAHKADLAIHLTGDCPLIDPRIVDEAVSWARAVQPDFCSNSISVRDILGYKGPTYPRGMDVAVMPIRAFEALDFVAQDPAEREHPMLYAYTHPDEFTCEWVPAPSELASDDRLCVDEPDDLKLVRAIFDALYPANPTFGLDEILAFLATRPDLRGINRHVRQKTPLSPTSRTANDDDDDGDDDLPF